MITSTIKTERLILRSMTQEDAELAFSIWGDAEQGKYLQDPYYKNVEELRGLFNNIHKWSDYPFMVFLEDGQFVGTCSIGPEDTNELWGFGYCVVKEEQGKGYATEMAKAIIKFAYRLGIHDFMAEHAIENSSSGLVLEKCGMHFERGSSFKKSGTDLVYPSNIYRLHLD
ncbi:GNAT family N-acetyltransferase [Clostridium sp. KNHs205]|uniref:GNAT family N-acetyltransferase n=1 Tax=Clostridium sp. KNHs205 TaxID=1449050 RepID=UPI00051AE0F8|nr:GNAT family N-acetyltransferase [Clostridium sp. KNHs205]